MIKAVIFDWGGVLIDNPHLIGYCAKSLKVNARVLESIFFKYESKFQKGVISEKKLWNKISSKLEIYKSTNKSLWGEAVKNVFTDKKEVYRLVLELKNKGFKTGILSNTELPAVKYFYDNKYDKYFDAVVFSCIEGMIKPNKNIYLLALKKLKVKPQEALFIDNSYENIFGAKRAGINGILFKNLDQLKKELKKFLVKLD